MAKTTTSRHTPSTKGCFNVGQQITGHSLVPQGLEASLPAMVRTELGRLSANRQEEFLEEYRRRRKSTGVAYLLWFIFGLQYGYLGRWGLQVVYWLTAGGVGIWALILLFFIPSLVRNYNKDVSIDVLRQQQAIAGSPAVNNPS